jgi:hypothetical protein
MLANDILIKNILDLHRSRKLTIIRFVVTFLKFLSNDVVTELNTLITDVDRRPSDQLSHFMLTLTTEIAVK